MKKSSEFDRNNAINANQANCPDDIFNFISASEMRESVEKIFFRWLIESQSLPQEVKIEAERVWFLMEYLKRVERR